MCALFDVLPNLQMVISTHLHIWEFGVFPVGYLGSKLNHLILAKKSQLAAGVSR